MKDKAQEDEAQQETAQQEGKKAAQAKPIDMAGTITYAVFGVLVLMIVLMQFQIASLVNVIGAVQGNGSIATGAITASAGSGLAGSAGTGSAIDVIPKGIPAVYGAELGVSYDDISANNPSKANSTIAKMGKLDVDLQLSGDNLQRYIKIAGSISCEYCCGADSIIFTKDSGKYKAGDAACGCAHSYAMRGLAKYLLINHADSYSDDQILEELGKWKTLYFPAQITEKAGALQANGIELNYINLASNKYRGIESGSGSGMVGGC